MATDLSTPLHLPCGAVLSNRLVKAALTEGLADAHNRATERHERVYRRWSEGGAGLLVTGNVQIDRNHLERPGNLVIDNNGGLEALRAVAKAGTVGGNQFWMQLNQPGRQTPAAINPAPLAPSAVAVKAAETGCGNPVAMSEAQILDVIRRFAHAASVARDCGFTGVQVHAAHGYMMSQFLSPLSNLRDDAWGGSLENRARILLEVVRAIRKAVGADFAVSVKLNSADFQKGGFTEEESMQVVRWLGEEKIDLLEISGGTYEQIESMAGRDDKSDSRAESTKRREAYFLDYAAKVRPIFKLPLMITGGFRARSAMLDALQSGDLDLIGLGRPLCVMPELCRRLLKNELDAAPAPERTMKLDRSAFEQMDERSFHVMETWSQLAWACFQVLRLGDGKEADLGMTLLEALSAYDASERAALAAMQEARGVAIA